MSIIGAIGGIAAGFLVAALALFTLVCVVPSFCLFLFLLVMFAGGEQAGLLILASVV